MMLALLAGCAAAGPKPVVKTAPRDTPIAVAPGQAIRPLSLAAFQLAVPPGKGVDYAEGGLACIPVKVKKTDQDISGPEAQQLLLGFVAAAFEQQGYSIDRRGEADLTLSPTLIAYTAALCRPYTGIGDRFTGFGRVWLQVRWVIAERSDGTLLLDLVTEGDAGVDSSIEMAARELMRRSIEIAARNLMADARFVALLAGEGATGTPRATTQPAPTEPSKLSPAALASAQSAFDRWLADNRDALVAAADAHLSSLGTLPKGSVRSLSEAQVRDLTAEGYVVLLTLDTAQGPQPRLFQVTLNKGRLQRLVLLT